MGDLLLRARPSGRGWFRRQQRVCISASSEPPPRLPSLRDRLPSLAAGNVCRLQMGSHESPKQKCSRRFLTTCTGVGMSLLDAKHINENSPRFVAKLIAKVEKTGVCAGVINEEETSVPNK
ncbi:delta-guaiene synthase 1 [Striga asiatica]|uniref:Delta-guaiene synthase 1 n=1 Tax=Striga asiatica TaxID=4170 RepID=A0A5A7PMW7_STRAF|nr:delta-guaiene synthase 1 [Striga asiatica]